MKAGIKSHIPTLLIPPFLLVQKFIHTTMHDARTWLQPTFRRLLWRTHTRVTYRDRSHVRPRVRIFDTASQGISQGSSVHARGALLLATIKPQPPSGSMRTALDDTSMLQNMTRGHNARNEHGGGSHITYDDNLMHCRPSQEASPILLAQLSGASRLRPPPAPCPGGIFAAVASRGRHRRPAGHSRALEQQAGSIT